MANTALADAAVKYASMGFAVLPLKPRGKEPNISHGVKDATADVAQVKSWWERHPNDNIGIAMGAASGGLVAIDIDVDEDAGKDGYDTLRTWENAHGELPETATSITGRGGYHMLYRMAGVGNSVGRDSAVDIRSDGGFIVAPPSIHPNGVAYQWEFDPEEFPPADADENVKAFVASVQPAKADGGERRKFERGAVGEGGRNDYLYRYGCGLRAKGIDPDGIALLVEQANEADCTPPLPDAEVARIIESVMQRREGYSDEVAAAVATGSEPDEPKRGPGRPRKFDHAAIARRIMDEHGACMLDGMPAVRDGAVYKVGWRNINSIIIDMSEDCTTTNRKEVCSYVDIKAPRVRQSPPNLVAFANGVLDVNTMELRPYSPDDVIPNVVPHDWDPFASCDAVDNTLRKMACGDPGMEMNLSEIMGLCLYRSAKYGYCPILLGEGSNGKSTYIKMLRALVGADNVSSLDINVIGERFQAVRLMGKLANLGDDISNEFLSGNVLAVVKKVATGDVVYSDVKNGQGVEFTPYATMVFSANKFPKLGDSSGGTMRRLFPLQFNARFSRDDQDFDPNIGEKLTSPEACRYMCRLAVAGLRRVIESGRMTPNLASVSIVNEIKVDNNTVLQWMDGGDIDGNTVVGMRPQAVYNSYHSWCLDNGVKPVSSRSFAGTLKAEWHVQSVPGGHETVGDERKTYRVYKRTE